MHRTKNTKLVTCLTCCLEKAFDQNNTMSLSDICWEYSYNLHLVADEEEAFLHSKQFPQHIMIEGMDYGYEVNGV